MNPERFVLNFTFLHNYNDIMSENYTLKVILPEGATDIKMHMPFEVDSITDEVVFSYLDFYGRPVKVIKKENV